MHEVLVQIQFEFMHILCVMAPRDGAIQPPRVCAANEFYDRLDGPLLRAMTVLAQFNPKWF